MLKGIDQRLSAEIVHVLMLMGHGDDLVICDVNHPAATIAAETTYGRLIDMAGCDIPTAARAILSLMPLDTFVPAPVQRMQVVGNPDGAGADLCPDAGRRRSGRGPPRHHCRRWSGSTSTPPPSGPSRSSAPRTPAPTAASS